MNIQRIIGLVLLVAGVTLLFFEVNAFQSVGEPVVEDVTGRFTIQAMWFLIGGIATLLGGAALTFWGGWRATEKPSSQHRGQEAAVSDRLSS